MHPEILRNLVAQHTYELREQAHQAALARTAGRARRAGRRGAAGPAAGDLAGSPSRHSRLRGRLVPDRRGPGAQPSCLAPGVPPEEVRAAGPHGSWPGCAGGVYTATSPAFMVTPWGVTRPG